MSKPKREGGLGFKDIEALNIALLGKQLWRLLTRKDTLLTKVFKARYFSKSNPLEAGLGSRPSFAWRSIHKAQSLIKQGARATIGNGKDVSIWDEPWLDSRPARPVLSTRRLDPTTGASISSLAKVSDLLSEDGKTWNDQITSVILREEDRSRLMEIFPGGPACVDGYCWEFTPSGHYTTKSGYWTFINRVQNVHNQLEVNQPSLEPIFKLVWEADTCPKIRHFLWKCISGCLPVAERLKCRHLIKDSSCARCQNKEESINHLLFQCSYARLVWAVSPLPAPPQCEMGDSLYDNFYRLMTSKPNFPFENETGNIVPWILWRLWKNRNDYMIKDLNYDAQVTVEKALDDMREWKSRLKEEETKSVSKPIVHDKDWKPPPQGWFKCNIDGAWIKEDGAAGIGWILRDCHGRATWMGGRRIPRLKSPIEAEAEALRWAISCVSRFNYKNIIFETDSKNLATAFKSDEEWPLLSVCIQECRHLLQSMGNSTVCFQGRDGNKAADRIAKEAISFGNNVSKLYSILPVWIKSLVESETDDV